MLDVDLEVDCDLANENRDEEKMRDTIISFQNPYRQASKFISILWNNLIVLPVLQDKLFLNRATAYSFSQIE